MAFVGIGVNDLAIRYAAINNGSLAGDPLGSLIDQVTGQIESAVDALFAAGSVKLVLANLLNFGVLPYIESRTTAEGRDRITDAVGRANRQIQQIADERSIPVVDVHGLTNLSRNARLTIGDVLIDTRGTSTDPHCFFLTEGLHPGTIAHGLYANAFLEAIGRAYELSARPLSDQEILLGAESAAGIKIEFDRGAQTYFDVSRYVRYVPEPSSLLLAMLGFVSVAACSSLTYRSGRVVGRRGPMDRRRSSGCKSRSTSHAVGTAHAYGPVGRG